MKIIKNNLTFIKYFISAGLSFAIDLLFFTIFEIFFKNIKYHIYISTALARIISSFFNYLLNRNIVFDKKDGNIDKKSLTGYYLLVVIQLFVSATLVSVLCSIITINSTLVKIPVDVAIFIVNYFIQKKIIFKKS